jgi:hypothetical protein
MYSDILYNICHSTSKWARYDINVYWSSSEVQLCLSYLNETWIFSTYFRKITQIWNCMKIRELGAQMFYVGRLTAMTKLTVALRNFANAPKDACEVPDSREQSCVSSHTRFPNLQNKLPANDKSHKSNRSSSFPHRSSFDNTTRLLQHTAKYHNWTTSISIWVKVSYASKNILPIPHLELAYTTDS